MNKPTIHEQIYIDVKDAVERHVKEEFLDDLETFVAGVIDDVDEIAPGDFHVEISSNWTKSGNPVTLDWGEVI